MQNRPFSAYVVAIKSDIHPRDVRPEWIESAKKAY